MPLPTVVLRILTALFWVTALVSRPLAARLAFRLFTTPVGSRKIRIEGRRLVRAQEILNQARREDQDGIAIWTWETGKESTTVILAHGWTSRALYMTGFVPALRDAGLRVVAFDFPGHGESAGLQLDFAEAGSLVVALANRYERVVLLGHSFGASMVTLAASGTARLAPASRVAGLVLVSGANELSGVSQRFADTFSLDRRVKELLDRKLEEIGGEPIEAFSGVQGVLNSNVPTLLVHDIEDKIVPYDDAVAIRSATGAKLWTTERLGHNRILYAGEVHTHIAGFLEELRHEGGELA